MKLSKTCSQHMLQITVFRIFTLLFVFLKNSYYLDKFTY